MNDTGLYQCKGINILGKAQETTRIVVNYSPRVSLPDGPIYVKQGDNVTLPTCHVIGYPKPKVTWSKALSELPKVRSLINGRNLTLLSAVKQDSGSYACTASNKLGSSVAMITVVVVSLPKFTTTPPSQVKLDPGATLTLDCQATGDPPAVVTWSKDNGPLPSGRSQVLNGLLTITGMTIPDSGKYVCKAVSAGVFIVTTSTMVTVDKPHDIKFPRRQSTSDYIVTRNIPSMTAVTMCFWLRTTYSGGSVISYAVSGSDNEILIYNPTSLNVFIGGDSWGTGVSANDGKWHHICATWENTAGQAIIYKGGSQSGKRNFKQGHVITAGGHLIIGQEQDSPGGSFEASQSYHGDLTDINVWNRVLGPSEIKAMSRDCAGGSTGNVLSWKNVISRTGFTFHGQVQINTPSSCKP